MLRELNLNEMEMVAGGDNTADCPPIIVNGGTTRGERERQNQILDQIREELNRFQVDLSAFGLDVNSISASDLNNLADRVVNARNDMRNQGPLEITITPAPGNLNSEDGSVNPPSGLNIATINGVKVFLDFSDFPNGLGAGGTVTF